MASRPFYSGDLAALNTAAADYERNQIAARSGNQAYLGQLANVALQRRGQDVAERQAAADRDNRMALAQLTDAGNRYAVDQQAALGRQRNANDLLASIQKNEQALAALTAEREKIAVLERQGIATNQLEKDKLERASKQIADELANRLEIARIQFNPDSQKVDPRVQNEILAGNMEIDSGNQQAAAYADVLNAKMKGMIWNDSPEDVLKGLTPEQAALVQITEDPATKTRKFAPRLRPRLALAQRPTAPALTPPVGTNAPAASVTNRVREFNWKSLVSPAATPAPVSARPSSPENYLSTLASIAGSRNNQRAAVEMEPAVARGEDLMSDASIQGLLQYLSAPTPQPVVEPVEPYVPQGPPQRLYDPRRSIPRGATRWPDYNPAQGLYADPSGRVFRIPVSTTGQY